MMSTRIVCSVVACPRFPSVPILAITYRLWHIRRSVVWSLKALLDVQPLLISAVSSLTLAFGKATPVVGLTIGKRR